MKRTFFIVLTTIAALTADACRCHRLSFTEEVVHADQIFIGTVLKKALEDKAYFLFSVSQIFKGSQSDTLTIRTGFGGPDCGMMFETGKTYVVYSHNKQTTWCNRNALASNNADLVKLKYLFEPSFSAGIGKTIDPALTDTEAEYFNADLLKQRKGFNFQSKKIAFVRNDSFIDKQQYFKNWGGKEVSNNLIILTDKEKQEANSYDAIIVSWRKQGVSNGFRKRLVKRLK